MDVCLSVTKYHKEEWQAAWTSILKYLNLVRTMLEAIIAFFPVKEDHDAIGSIDYPAQVRSKLAINSQKWSCESCGPIKNTIPEKKPKVAANANSEVDSPYIIEDNKSDNKSDNISEVSGVQKPETNHEHKVIKKTKAKKIDFDRKSHLSYPVEGIIIEDINEDDEIEEKSRDNESVLKATNMVELGTGEEVENIPIDYLRKDSSTDPVDFVDYLKRLRSGQFDINENKEKGKTIEKPKILNTLVSSNKTNSENINHIKDNSNENSNVNLREVILNSPYRKKSNSAFKQYTNDESEFYDIIKTVQTHQSKSIEDIEKDLQQSRFNTNSRLLKDLNNNDHDIDDALIKDNATNINSFNLNTNNTVDQKEQIKSVLKAIDIFNQKDKLEAILKKKNNALKYFVREKYKDAKKIRQRIINLSMVVIIGLVFLAYYLLKTYYI
jgi:hypothetical protein